MNKVHRATHRDPIIGAAFLKVINMIEPPASLLSPSIIWRVLFNTVKKRIAAKGKKSA